MTTFELRGVSKTYGDGPTEVNALVDVNLEVHAGALVAVMGASGSGKSALSTIAGTLEEPTSGEVLVDGVPVSAMSRNDLARLRRRTIGYVFQDFNLLAGLTAAENVALPLELDGLPRGSFTNRRQTHPVHLAMRHIDPQTQPAGIGMSRIGAHTDRAPRSVVHG